MTKISNEDILTLIGLVGVEKSQDYLSTVCCVKMSDIGMLKAYPQLISATGILTKLEAGTFGYHCRVKFHSDTGLLDDLKNIPGLIGFPKPEDALIWVYLDEVDFYAIM